MIERLLEDPRVRIALFVGVALFLLLIFIWSTTNRNVEEQTLPPSRDSLVENDAPEQLPDREPVTQPSDLPPPVPLPDPEKKIEPPVVTPGNIEKFLRTVNTFTSEDTPEEYTEAAVSAGAVPGSPASRIWLAETELRQCTVEGCSSEALEVSSIEIGADRSASGLVKVRKSVGSQEFTVLMLCSLDLARGTEASRGLFVMVDCYRGSD